jgi:alkanesulfonate monooxygenase SsuD/methylene tetrahydromethanopterin reductase-like flavin-dependent oxidoreductase (luciferase family)
MIVAGRGVYQDHYRYFSGSWDESDGMLCESVELLRRLWSTSDVHWSGAWRPPLDGVTVQPRPMQQPHPPIWLSASSASSVQRAIALRCPIVIPTVSTGVALPAQLAAAYRHGWRAAGHDPSEAKVALHVHAYAGAGSTADARRLWGPYQTAYLSWVLRDVRGSSGRLPPPFEVSDRPDAQAVCGSVDDVAHELNRRIAEIDGVDRLLVQCDQGGFPPDEALACADRLVNQVVPRLPQR